MATIIVNPGGSIQSAITSAVTGDIVQLTPGTIYNTSTIITLNKTGVTFDGNGSTIKLNSNTPAGTTQFRVSGSGNTVRNLILDGNKFNLAGGPDNWGWSDTKLIGLNVVNCINCIFEQLN